MKPELAFIDLAAQYEHCRTGIDAALARVLAHGAYIMGPEVAELERRLEAFANVGHAISCSNGTEALVLALRALDIGSGDAVLVPSFTFAATAEAVCLAGATPVFVDIDPRTFNLAPQEVQSATTIAVANGLRPRAVIAVDLFGQPVEHDLLGAAAGEAELLVIVDAAQSFGSTWRGDRAGSLGLIATTSFFPAKPLGCYGDGGALFTNNDDIAGVLRSLRVHGQGTAKYDNVRIGTNARLDTIQAAVLLEKMGVFEGELVARQAIADRYSEALRDYVVTPIVLPPASSAWAQYTIRVPNRDVVAAHMHAAGVPTAVYYPRPLHHQPAYVDFPRAGSLPEAERAAAEVLSLPMHPYMNEEQQDRVISALLAAVSQQPSR